MINKIILSITLGSFSLMASGAGAIEAAQDSMTGDNPVRAATGSPTRTATTGTSTTAGSTFIMPTGQGGNAAQSGRSAQNAQLIGAAVNIGAATMFSAKCATVAGGWACPLAAMSFMAAGSLGRASGGSGAAGSAMSAYDPSMYSYNGTDAPVVDQWGNAIAPGGSTGPGGTNVPVGTITGSGGRLPDGTTSLTIARDVANLRSNLEKSGALLSADGKTMTTKDGRKFDLTKGADGSMEGLMAMGLTAAEAQQAAAAGARYGSAANAKYSAMMAKMTADGGGGAGGGAGRGPAAEGGGAGGYGGYRWSDPRSRPRTKAKVAGLTRKLGDDTIGVAGDDIFEMVTRRYKARDQDGQFLKD